MSDAPAGDRMMRHGLLLLVAAQVGNICNVLFHMLVGRALGAAEYGILAAMLNLLLVFATPLDALRNAMAHYAARLHVAGDRAAIRALARHWLLRMLFVGALAAVLGVLFRGALASFFHLATPLPLMMAALMMPSLLTLPVLAGTLQGVQSFAWMSTCMQGWGVIRLLGAGLLVALGLATAGTVVGAHALGMVFSVAIGVWGVACLTRGAGHAAKPAGMGGYFVQSLLLLGGYGVLMNSDVMLVRHFHPEQAGYYAWAATIGRSVIFLPMPIALAMFPKVISMGGSSRDSRSTLLRALGLSSVLIGVSVAVTWAVPGLGLRILYGVTAPTPEQLALVRWVVLAMSPLGFTYLLLHFEMAQHRFGSLPWIIACAAAYIGVAWHWHGTLWHLVAALGGASLLSAVVYLIAVLRAGQPRRNANSA